MSFQSEQLKDRTIAFAINVLRLLDKLPQTAACHVVGRQLAKSATSVGANYRSCCNARSRAEFVAKLGIVVEESEESLYWLGLLIGAQLLPSESVLSLKGEAVELRAIFARSLGTARTNLKASKSLQSSINDQITK